MRASIRRSLRPTLALPALALTFPAQTFERHAHRGGRLDAMSGP